jgi:thioredoxin 2
MHLICPHCDVINRIPRERLGASPKCGACHEPLFTRHPIALTTARFDRYLARGELPLLVDFWAPWCGPCRTMAPAFEAAAAELEPRFQLLKIDTEAEPALAGRYSIRSIPTLMVFSRGVELARRSGALDRREIVRWATQQEQAA